VAYSRDYAAVWAAAQEDVSEGRSSNRTQCSMGSAQATLRFSRATRMDLRSSRAEECTGVAVVPDGRVGRYVQALET
jgi:hypothetical protein